MDDNDAIFSNLTPTMMTWIDQGVDRLNRYANSDPAIRWVLDANVYKENKA